MLGVVKAGIASAPRLATQIALFYQAIDKAHSGSPRSALGTRKAERVIVKVIQKVDKSCPGRLGMIARLKIIEHEHGQSFTLPPELTLAASEVFVTKDGNRLVVEPVMVSDKGSFFEWLRTIEPWDGPGPEENDPIPEEIEP